MTVLKSAGRTRLLADGAPVTAINLALRDRSTIYGASQASLRNYVASARLLVEYVARRGSPHGRHQCRVRDFHQRVARR